MTRILRLTRNVPSRVRLSNAHLPGAAACAAEPPRVRPVSRFPQHIE